MRAWLRRNSGEAPPADQGTDAVSHSLGKSSAKPYTAPQSLSNDEYYAITAYVLFLNELITEDDKMDAASLPKIAMPNRDGFVLEARPDTEDSACISNCRQGRAVNVMMDSRRFVEPVSGSGTDKPE